MAQQVEILTHQAAFALGGRCPREPPDRLQRRRAPRQPEQDDADDDQRQRLDLSHRQPAEREVAELHVGLAHEFDRETEDAVQQREQTRYRIARARLARINPQHREHDDAFEREFIELRGMPRLVVELAGQIHLVQLVTASCRSDSSARGKITPHGSIGVLAPQLAVDEIAETAEAEADRHQRRDEIDGVEKM